MDEIKMDDKVISLAQVIVNQNYDIIAQNNRILEMNGKLLDRLANPLKVSPFKQGKIEEILENMSNS